MKRYGWMLLVVACLAAPARADNCGDLTDCAMLVATGAAIIGGLILAAALVLWLWPELMALLADESGAVAINKATVGLGAVIAGEGLATHPELASELATAGEEMGEELTALGEEITGELEGTQGNLPETINGRSYSGHALDQMEGRNLTPTIIENAVNTGETFPGKFPDTTAYYDRINNVTVILNQAGRVITAHKGFPTGIPAWMK